VTHLRKMMLEDLQRRKRAIALDYFTYCEVSLFSAHCDAQASEGGHAGVSRCCQ
jgi:hypothetical protein